MYGRLEGSSVASLIEVLDEQRTDVRSLRGIAKVRITFQPLPGEDEESFSTSQAVLASAPGAFRLDSLSPFGVSYSAVSDGSSLAVLAPDEGTIYRGQATPETVASATGVEATPEDITRILLGQPPVPAIEGRLAWASSSHDGGTAETRPGGEGAEVFLHAPSAASAGETVLVGFARAPVAGGVAVPVSFERIDAKGTVQLRARFGEHQDFGGHVLPTRIEVTAPGSKVTVTYRELEANPELQASSFQLVTPSGMKDLPLGPRIVTSVGP
ncbi:MAG: hypothetical protein P8R42_03120 [Candidatus Binatia bacterium]|nr:hypothetical protein [Candidatus Binatia bacterium]